MASRAAGAPNIEGEKYEHGGLADQERCAGPLESWYDAQEPGFKANLDASPRA